MSEFAGIDKLLEAAEKKRADAEKAAAKVWALPMGLNSRHSVAYKEGSCSKALIGASNSVSEVIKIYREIQTAGIKVIFSAPEDLAGVYHRRQFKQYLLDSLKDTQAGRDLETRSITTKETLEQPATTAHARRAMPHHRNVLKNSQEAAERAAALTSCIISEMHLSSWFDPSMFADVSIDEYEKARELMEFTSEVKEQLEADLNDEGRRDIEILTGAMGPLDSLESKRDKCLSQLDNLSTKFLHYPEMAAERTKITPTPERSKILSSPLVLGAVSPYMMGIEISVLDPPASMTSLTAISNSFIDKNCLGNLKSRLEEKLSSPFALRGNVPRMQIKELHDNIREIIDWAINFISKHGKVKKEAIGLLNEYVSIIEGANKSMSGAMYLPLIEEY